ELRSILSRAYVEMHRAYWKRLVHHAGLNDESGSHSRTVPVTHPIVRVKAECRVQVATCRQIIGKRAARVPSESRNHGKGHTRGHHGKVTVTRRLGRPSRGKQHSTALEWSIALHLHRFMDVVSQAARAQPRHFIAIDVITPKGIQLRRGDNVE